MPSYRAKVLWGSERVGLSSDPGYGVISLAVTQARGTKQLWLIHHSVLDFFPNLRVSFPSIRFDLILGLDHNKFKDLP